MSLFDTGLDIAKSVLGIPGLGDLGKLKEKVTDVLPIPKSGNFITDYLLAQVGLKEETEKVKEESEKERAGLFGEAIGSSFKRLFPTLSKWLDLGKTGGAAVGLFDRGPEGHALQHEIDSLTSFTLFIPDFMLKYATDIFHTSEIFQKVVEIWPLMPEELKKAMKDPNYDPDDLISIIRIMNQDIATGNVTYESLIKEGIGGMIPDFLKGRLLSA